MAVEDVLPQILSRLFSGNFDSQVNDNTPFQGFAAPLEVTELQDTILTATFTGPARYGHVGLYGCALYAGSGSGGGMGHHYTEALAFTQAETPTMSESHSGAPHHYTQTIAATQAQALTESESEGGGGPGGFGIGTYNSGTWNG